MHFAKKAFIGRRSLPIGELISLSRDNQGETPSHPDRRAVISLPHLRRLPSLPLLPPASVVTVAALVIAGKLRENNTVPGTPTPRHHQLPLCDLAAFRRANLLAASILLAPLLFIFLLDQDHNEDDTYACEAVPADRNHET